MHTSRIMLLGRTLGLKNEIIQALQVVPPGLAPGVVSPPCMLLLAPSAKEVASMKQISIYTKDAPYSTPYTCTATPCTKIAPNEKDTRPSCRAFKLLFGTGSGSNSLPSTVRKPCFLKATYIFLENSGTIMYVCR